MEMNIHIKTPIVIDTSTIVVGSPFSGVIAGKGYANLMGLEYDQIICKTKNIRSFILDNDIARKNACYQKFGFNVDKIKGKNIVLVDDSLVRGHTIRIMIEVLKELGARDIHIRIASPPIKYPCYFGVDIPTEKELIANNTTFDKIVDVIGATSLIYLCMKDVKKIHGETMCHSCFTGEYMNELLDW
jgi:amidophosphoribosyltransferase